jgi:sucrose-6-phosphate hydrolase SacC (GH32 family)
MEFGGEPSFERLEGSKRGGGRGRSRRTGRGAGKKVEGGGGLAAYPVSLSTFTMIRTILLAVVACGAVAAQEREPLYKESLRPQFHFTARYWDDYRLHPPNHEEGWINDMNGLVHFDGTYHFFAQRWWSAWLHATSEDLIHWKEFRPAFGKGGKFGGTQSGGGVIDTHNSSGLGDGKTPPMLAFWSSTDNLNQCMSYSLDRGLTWSKYEKNPILTHAYRDPKVFWHEPTSKWVMILYGPSDTTAPPRYGFNGEKNDAHALREGRGDGWVCSVTRVFPDGKVVVTDQDGSSAGQVDVKLLNVGGAGFYIGQKANGSEGLKGEISEILVYDRPLTDREADASIARLTGRPGEAAKEGLMLHLDAAQMEGASGSKVERWKDLSGKGRDVVQADGAKQPLRGSDPTGKPVVAFGGGSVLRGDAVLEEGDDSFTIVARWRLGDPAGSQVICEQNSGDGASGRRAALLSSHSGEPENHYLLFESKNLLSWKRLPGSIPDSYECPDMFELPVTGGARGERKWVVIDANGDYITGRFDGSRFEAETKKRKGDFGKNFYATMTFENMPASDPRRVQLAWMRAWDEYPKNMPFNQQVSFPCELTLHKTAEGPVMYRNPIREISKLYGEKVVLADQVVKPGTNPLAGVRGELFDIRVKLDVARSKCSGLVMNLCGNTVKYDLRRSILNSHGSEVPLKPEKGEVEIRVLVDRLSLETFGNGGAVSITNFAQRRDGAVPVELLAEEGEAFLKSVEVYELESIWK